MWCCCSDCALLVRQRGTLCDTTPLFTIPLLHTCRTSKPERLFLLSVEFFGAFLPEPLSDLNCTSNFLFFPQLEHLPYQAPRICELQTTYGPLENVGTHQLCRRQSNLHQQLSDELDQSSLS